MSEEQQPKLLEEIEPSVKPRTPRVRIDSQLLEYDIASVERASQKDLDRQGQSWRETSIANAMPLTEMHWWKLAQTVKKDGLKVLDTPDFLK